MIEFSVKQYLLDNRLVNEMAEVVTSEIFPRSPTWGIGPYSNDRALVYLVTLVHFFEYHAMLDNLGIFIVNEADDKQAYTIYINEIDRKYDYAHPSFDWGVVSDTIEFLVKPMTDSEMSRLGKNLFFKDE